MPEKKPLTDKEYVGKGGLICPYCGSDQITGDEINVDAGHATQEVSCEDCKKEWQDVYRLTGYSAK
jgi:hypothetical protein